MGGMDVVGVKVLSGFLFFFIALFFGCLPFFLFRRCLAATAAGKPTTSSKPGQGSKLVQCLHALASGVLIATCLLHLLPESLENVQNAQASRQRLSGQGEGHDDKNFSDSSIGGGGGRIGDDKIDPDVGGSLYPLAELLVAIGFLAIFIIDTTFKAAQSHKGDTIGGNRIKYSRLKNVDDDEDEIEIFTQKVDHPLKNYDESRERKTDSSPLDENDNDSENTPESFRRDRYPRSKPNSNGELIRFPSDELVSKQQDHVRSIALVMALCIHGFFDGVILGLQTSTSTLFSLLLALLLHKLFVATSLSFTLLKNYSPLTSRLRVVIYVVLFASVAPVGIITSAAFIHSRLFATQGADDISLAPGCVQAFAVGTFLYVAFTEATGRHGEARSLRFEILCHVFLLIGFFFMAMMRLTLNDS